MGKLQKFFIEFESRHGVYFPGQSACGNVCIELSEPTNLTG